MQLLPAGKHLSGMLDGVRLRCCLNPIRPICLQVIRDRNHLDFCPMVFIMNECKRVSLEAALKLAPDLLRRFWEKPYQESAMSLAGPGNSDLPLPP